MKQIFTRIFAITMILTLAACHAAPKKTELPSAYTPILQVYQTALNEGWSVEQCMDSGVNYLLALSQYEIGIGYTVTDLDGDGTEELLIATLPGTEDTLSQKLIYDLYTQKDGQARLVFGSIERNRLYSLGGDLFANIGSSGWDSSVNTTLQFKNGALIDLQIPTEEVQYVQLELTPLEKIVA